MLQQNYDLREIYHQIVFILSRLHSAIDASVIALVGTNLKRGTSASHDFFMIITINNIFYKFKSL